MTGAGSLKWHDLLPTAKQDIDDAPADEAQVGSGGADRTLAGAGAAVEEVGRSGARPAAGDGAEAAWEQAVKQPLCGGVSAPNDDSRCYALEPKSCKRQIGPFTCDERHITRKRWARHEVGVDRRSGRHCTPSLAGMHH